MISYIKGNVIDKTDSTVTVEVNGIGYEVWVPYGVIAACERQTEAIELYTYLQVREDQIALFGFLNRNDLRTFKLLITVSGIGPKGALAVLSYMTTEKLILAVLSDDAKAIAKVPGIGAKTAGKVVLELKDKFSTDDLRMPGVSAQKLSDGENAAVDSEVVSEAVMALTALGYSSSESLKAVRSVKESADMTSDRLLKLALKYL